MFQLSSFNPLAPDFKADPASFDIGHFDGRIGNLHLAFGTGVQLCLGASLASLEGEIALTSILKRMPNIQQVNDNVLQRDTF